MIEQNHQRSAARSYEGRVVLVTGGTKGIGLGTALAFARHGAQLVLTHKWGSADEAELAEKFRAVGAPAPFVVEADISRSDETQRLFELIRDRCGRVDALISNASAAVTVQSLDDLTERAFLKSMRASAWPVVDYTLAAKRVLGVFPRYVIIMSSDGPDRFTPAYDFVASGKAAAETFARYLAYRLRDEGTRVNVVRSRAIKTDAFTDTFGNEFYGFLRRFVSDDWFMTVDEVADAAFALCSGMFDAMTGQVVMVDRGNTFADGISTIYAQRAELGL
ncbi:MAG TPA: SDR family oxidoreductase [Kofleriaceae bacterium]|jgi:NAD(P)-dependent dehydrogenase (short-subunit alcohol dehydrogenase family)